MNNVPKKKRYVDITPWVSFCYIYDSNQICEDIDSNEIWECVELTTFTIIEMMTDGPKEIF